MAQLLCPNSKHMLQWNRTHRIYKLLEANLTAAGAAWTGDAMGRENSFQKSASQAEGGQWYLVSTAADGKSPAVVKGVRISPSVCILLTLRQPLRDAELSVWYLTCIQLPSVFNSLQHFSTVLGCTQLFVARDELTLNTMKILLEAEEKQGLHTSFFPSYIPHFWD